MRKLLVRLGRFVRGLQTAWSILGLTLVAILLTEASLRALFAVKDSLGSPGGPDRRVIELGYGGESWPLQHERELRLLEDRWQPYVYFRQKPFAGRTITIDADGLRRTWTPPPSGDRAGKLFRVLMLGGSTLWGYGARR